MADSAVASTTPLEPRPKKRKLKHPRTQRACEFCRKRKVRCSGTYPCDMCVREEAVCEGLAPTSSPWEVNTTGRSPISCDRPALQLTGDHSATSTDYRVVPVPMSTASVHQTSTASNNASRRSSIEPPQTFGYNHVGPTSGVSFLYGQWGKGANSEPKANFPGDDTGDMNISHARLISWGDLPQIENTLSEPVFTTDQILDILDRYFQSISPTYRFHHHQTVKKWALAMVSHSRLSAAQRACVLLVCAQTLLHIPASSGHVVLVDSQHHQLNMSDGRPPGNIDFPERAGPQVIGRGDRKLSTCCSEAAKVLLDNEPGPPSLASVQSRIGLCLYLLSTFRLNECRYCFSFAVTVATTLGIHRRQSSSSKISTLEAECRKRTFWSMYVLDGYLSVMLGRPRLIRDEDIDQPFPSNISDSDLMSSEPIEDLPRHGDLEAFISHAKLAKLMARGNDQLYPLYPLSNDQLLQRSNEMVDSLSQWQDDLPKFLQARNKTFTGQRTFERQNTILKLAWAHARILATRRCLLIDFGHDGSTPFSLSQDAQAKGCIKECISAIVMILETIEALIENGQCYGSFWSTQYVALVAISTLYVFIIRNIKSVVSIEEHFEKARKCHDHLATLPPAGSQAQRHLVLLSQLRSKAERLSRHPRSTPAAPQTGNSSQVGISLKSKNGESFSSTIGARLNDGNNNVTSQAVPAILSSGLDPQSMDRVVPMVAQDAPNDISMFGSLLTPNSNADNSFQYMLDFGWESLDTIGASMRSEGLFGVGL